MIIKQAEYGEWLKYVKASTLNGIRSKEFEILKTLSPVVNVCYENFFESELAKLEVRIINDSITLLQKSIQDSFENMDIYAFEKGLKNFKKYVRDSLFFESIEGYPENLKIRIEKNIRLNFSKFTKEISIYLKKCLEYGNNIFFDEINYVYKRANIEKYIRELMSYE